MTFKEMAYETVEIKKLANKEAKEIVNNNTKDELIETISALIYEQMIYQNSSEYYKYYKGKVSIALNIPFIWNFTVDEQFKIFADENFNGGNLKRKIENAMYNIKDHIECRDYTDAKYYRYTLYDNELFETLNMPAHRFYPYYKY